MRQIARKTKAGFTLIELMVVILILGLLAAAIGVAVVNVIGENKNKLDAKTLSDFVDKFIVKLEENNGQNKGFIKKSGEAPTARELMVRLYRKKYIGFEEIKKLAGASGTAGGEADYAEGGEVTDDMIIFTTSNDPKTMIDMVSSKNRQADFGVSFCYNARYMGDKASDGCVIIFASERQAESMNESLVIGKWDEFQRNKSGGEGGSADADSGTIDFARPDEVFEHAAFKNVAKE
ncbi:MAG: type II secretion system protein [Planctomycetes bacterium]|nr:type II secretion system protein [Planctomycetota bacterium]